MGFSGHGPDHSVPCALLRSECYKSTLMLTLNEIRDVLHGFDRRRWHRPSIGHHMDRQLRLWEGVIPGLRPTTAPHLIFEDDPLLTLTVRREEFDSIGCADDLDGMDVSPLAVVACYAGTAVIGLLGLELTGEGVLGVDPLDATLRFVVALDDDGAIDVGATPTFADIVSSIEGKGGDDPFDLFCHLGLVIEPDEDDRALADLHRSLVVEIEVDGRFVRPPTGTEGPTFVITAYNPGSDRPSDDENDAEMSLLLTDIERLATHGTPEDLTVHVTRARGWSIDRGRSEPSWAVTGISRSAARSLGRTFGQVAIFEIDATGTYVLGCSNDWRVPLNPAP